jgi:ribose transport system ATP-binding protein
MAEKQVVPFILEMRGISKRFDAVQALENVRLNVQAGTIHALIGENGAGKSTLMKILSGSLKPDAGSMLLHTQAYAPDGPRQARHGGVSMIYQELTLAPHLSVEENITLGFENQKLGIIQHQWKDVRDALALLGVTDIDLKTRVMNLSLGQQQLVEIARSLLLKSSIIVMDEPTSSLSSTDTQNLFAAIRRLKNQGVTIIYISHFLEELQEIADDYTVLRDGKSVATGSMRETNLSQLITFMVGRALDDMFPRVPHTIGKTLLSVKNLSHPPAVKNVSLDVHAGEILGIAGLVGSGRTETLRTIFGLDRAHSGSILIHDQEVQVYLHHPRQSLDLGMSMLSENRKEEGLAIDMPVRDNVSFSSLQRFADALGRLHLKKELGTVSQVVDQISLKYYSLLDAVSSLSGGNQQKVALARVLLDGSTVLLFDEPTRGIDVKSKVEIYSFMGNLAAQGFGIVLVSSYLPELFGVCDSLAVMYRGKLSPVKPVNEWSEESVMACATTGNN